jgi:hypothetical protein
LRDWDWHRAFRERAVESASTTETACVEGDRERDAGSTNVIRYALMASYLYVRAMEVTDGITRMAIDLIHRLDTRSEKQIHREFLALPKP